MSYGKCLNRQIVILVDSARPYLVGDDLVTGLIGRFEAAGANVDVLPVCLGYVLGHGFDAPGSVNVNGLLSLKGPGRKDQVRKPNRGLNVDE